MNRTPAVEWLERRQIALYVLAIVAGALAGWWVDPRDLCPGSGDQPGTGAVAVCHVPGGALHRDRAGLH